MTINSSRIYLLTWKICLIIKNIKNCVYVLGILKHISLTVLDNHGSLYFSRNPDKLKWYLVVEDWEPDLNFPLELTIPSDMILTKVEE